MPIAYELAADTYYGLGVVTYTPRAEIFDVTTSIPTVALRMEIWKKARRIADEMIIKAQKRWVQSKNPPRTYQDGDLVWLEGRNLRLDRPAIKLAPKRHGPFKITRVLSPITYQLELLPQWKIHDVFHIDLLTPYHEMDIHGANFTQPPPDLINGEEEYEVEEILDSRKHGRGHKVQYLVKWKGYPSSDNQWVNWDDMHAEEALAEFRKRKPEAISHIKRGESEEQDPSPLMQSNAPTVSTTLLDSPASSTISDPFVPNTFSTEGQGIETTVAEAFLSWQPQIPSSWRTPSPPSSEDAQSNEVNSDDGSAVCSRVDSREQHCHFFIPQTLIPTAITPSYTITDSMGNTPFIRTLELTEEGDENRAPVFFPCNVDPIPIPPPRQIGRSSSLPDEDAALYQVGLLPANPGDVDQRPSVPRDEAAQNDEEALALSTPAGGVEGDRTASISRDANKWTDADLLPTWEDAGLATPPDGYKVNHGATYYPLEVTREDGVVRIVDFVKVKWSGNPIICGRFKDDPAVYFDYLHAIPVIQSQPIRTYTSNEISFYKEPHPLAEEVDDAVEWLGDVSLKAELTHWRNEDSRLNCILFEQEQLDTEKWKLQMSHTGTTRRLSGAKLDDRVKRANRGKVGDLIAEYKRRRGSSNVKRG